MTSQTGNALFSIIMPAYNEQDVVETTVKQLCSYLDQTAHPYELIIVDDASVDNTPQILARLAQEYPQVSTLRNAGPNGYGYAIRKGLEVYRGDAVVVVTSDGSDAPKDVAAYFDAIRSGSDCAFGNRFGEGARVTGYPPVKLAINRLANRLIAALLGASYGDFTNGFKCYRREVIEEMRPFVSGQFNITIEMSLKAVLARRSFAIVPTDWTQRDAGQSSFKVLKLIKPYTATLLYCVTRSYLQSVSR